MTVKIGDRTTVTGTVRFIFGGTQAAHVHLDGDEPDRNNYVTRGALAKATVVPKPIVPGDVVRFKNPNHPANTYDVIAIDRDDAFVRYHKTGETFVIKEFSRKLEVVDA